MKPIFTLSFLGLLLWTIGFQSSEVLASIGLWICIIISLPGFLSLIKNERTQLFKTWWPLVLLFIWALIINSVLGAPPRATGVARLCDWLGIPAAAFCLSLQTKKQLHILIVSLSIVLLLSCFVAGLQFFGLWPQLHSLYGLERYVHSLPRVYEHASDKSEYFKGGGLLFHRLKFAHSSSLAIIFILTLSLFLQKNYQKILWLVASLAFLSVMLFPFARAALVSLLVALLVSLLLFFLKSKNNKNNMPRLGAIFALFLVLATSIILLNEPLKARLLKGLDESGRTDRMAIWRTGFKAIAYHPITGVGLGRFKPALYGDEFLPQVVFNSSVKAHNQFLTFAAETGIIGLLLFLCVLLMLIKQFKKNEMSHVLGFSVLVFFVLLSLTHDPLFHPTFSMGFTLILGVCWFLSKQTVKTEKNLM